MARLGKARCESSQETTREGDGTMTEPRIYADFHNLDDLNRLRLNCQGTKEDLARQKVQLREGLPLTFYMDDADANGKADPILVRGTVSFNQQDHCWVATVDWGAVWHQSEEPQPRTNGQTSPSNDRKGDACSFTQSSQCRATPDTTARGRPRACGTQVAPDALTCPGRIAVRPEAVRFATQEAYPCQDVHPFPLGCR